MPTFRLSGVIPINCHVNEEWNPASVLTPNNDLLLVWP